MPFNSTQRERVMKVVHRLDSKLDLSTNITKPQARVAIDETSAWIDANRPGFLTGALGEPANSALTNVQKAMLLAIAILEEASLLDDIKGAF